MVERQDTNPNTTLNGYIMEFWRFDLTWKLKCPMQQKYDKKNKKKPQKEGELSSTIMDQKSIYNSTHKPQRSLNETLEFNHGHHQY